jgi:predicted Na+-dependent transporter
MNLLAKNTWLIILIAILISFLVPIFGSILKPYLNIFLMVLMFLSCLDIDLKEFWTALKDFKIQALILLIVHLVSPLIVLIFFKRFLSEEIFLGLILASVIPAGRAAVFLVKIYGGKPVTALVISSISNALSPITVPFLVWLFAKTSIKINPLEMGTTILWLVAVPIIAAILVRWIGLAKYLVKSTSGLSVIFLFLIIIGIISPIRQVIIDNWEKSIWLILIILGLISFDFWLGWKIGKTKEDKITLAVTSSYKNYTLGTLVALSMFNPVVALPSIIYTITNNLMLIPIQILSKRSRVK